MPLVELRRNIGTISLLSVVLVIVSAFIIGFVLYAILPKLEFGAAIALGAVVSPTDAVAATAMAKRFGLPARLVTVLEGEGLVNDASALVLLKAAIGAAGVSISVWPIAGNFLYSVVVAVLIGFVVGIVTVWVRSKLNDPMLDTVVSFAVPFIAYLPVEALGGSGVLSVVVAGLYSGHNGARYFTAQSRISERLNWRTVAFVLENGVFLLMGLELTTVISEARDSTDAIGVFGSIGLGLFAVVLLLAIRAMVIGPLMWGLRERKSPQRATRRMGSIMRRVHGSGPPGGSSGIGWRGGVVLTWAGMRGVVTLAAAQSLPGDTPYRPQLVLIAFTVAIVTLLLQGGTMPWIIRPTKVRGTDQAADRRELATLLGLRPSSTWRSPGCSSVTIRRTDRVLCRP